MKITIKPKLAILLNAFIVLSLLLMSKAKAQASIDIKPDTLRILNGHVNILLKQGTYDTLKTGQLIKMYSSEFNEGTVVSTKGFKFNESSSLRFYQTSIENHESNDGGLSTWKLIESFTDKVPNARWMESKWEAHAGGPWYFVKLVSGKNASKVYKFIFFYIDRKLAFCVHEYAVDSSQTCADNSDPKNYLTYVYASTHPSRYEK